MLLVAALQLAMVTCIGVFNPLLATARLEQTAPERVARTLTAWSISTSAAIAATTALWGVLAAVTTPRAAIAVAGVLLLASPLLLPRRGEAERDEQGPREGELWKPESRERPGAAAEVPDAVEGA